MNYTRCLGLVKVVETTSLIETMIIRPFYKESILEKTYSHKILFYTSRYLQEQNHCITLQLCIDEKYLQFLNCSMVVKYIIIYIFLR